MGGGVVPFGGIEGKVLAEERSDTVSSRNIEYFTRFKREHADKFVLVHLDGAGRLPDFETTGWWAGAWLYKAGTALTQAAAAADTVLAVASTTRRLTPATASSTTALSSPIRPTTRCSST